jgi:methylase of polypeptide subunit release factors
VAARKKTRVREAQLAFEALSIEGGLLSPDWLSRVAQLAAGGQSEAEYRIPKGLNLRDEIGRYWRIAQAHWHELAAGRSTGAEAKGLAERFVLALLRESFGFTSVAPVAPTEIADRVYPIGFSALEGRVPVIIAPVGSGLDTLSAAFGDGGRRRSAFGLAQEFLNGEDDALWGIACDGVMLRILRDNASLTRPAWIEADLGRIFTEDRYPDFAALWLLAHATRFGGLEQPVADCALEMWRVAGREDGTRAREHLRRGVEQALVALGEGFLSHPANMTLRTSLQNGSLTTAAYFQQLLRLVYRFIFLLTVEERGLLHPDASAAATRNLYAEGYSVKRLREKAVRRSTHDRFSDLWETIKIVFRGLGSGEPRLALPALAGIFSKSQCAALDIAKLENRALLLAVLRLSWLREPSGLARVNWRDMGPEELGSVYESLLELVPEISVPQRSFRFAGDDTDEHSRRTTGSYYTPERLVQVLLDSAFEPVVQRTIAAHPEKPAEALLRLSIVDPTCGSGHFLLAAARRLAMHVARFDANGTPSAAEYRHALRQVVGRCIYGVDLNPMAVELCKVSLWMEAVEPGLPLTFLNSHILHGNALLGATPELMAKGIPDAAWDPIERDDKKTAAALKKRNAKAAEGQRGFDSFWSKRSVVASEAVTSAIVELDASSDVDVDALIRKESQWAGILESDEYRRQRLVADTWCAAFMWPKTPGAVADNAPTNEVWRQLRDGQGQPAELIALTTGQLASRFHFFHWHLAFPQVFANGGFDLLIGNPPWIAHAGRAAQPLAPQVKAFSKTVYGSFGGYPTTHGMFVERAAHLLAQWGGLGMIIPSSLSELPSYEPTRLAHDAVCGFSGELIDFGEGQFPGVTQPCMALVSQRRSTGRDDDAPGSPWPMARPDLTVLGRALLDSIAKLLPLPRELFGERGFQSDESLAEHFQEGSEPHGRFVRPLRGGSDIREFQLGPPSYHADPAALGKRLRDESEYREVRLVVRNTARYPIAALSDGCAFRNSLLAVFESTEWPAHALLALLNSAFVRWAHFHRFRDARQPVMPQLKIAHLRSIPTPPTFVDSDRGTLGDIGRRLTARRSPPSEAERAELDRTVFDLYAVSAEAREMVNVWHAAIHSTGPVRARRAKRAAA